VVIHRELITTLVARHRLPAIYSDPVLVQSGGHMSYSPDRVDIFRRAASYVDRILRGEKPGDLPVQQPVKFELVLNLNAAKALGLTVPDKLLIAADDVIEWKDSFAAVAHSRSWHKASEAKASEFTSAFGGSAELHGRTASAAFDANDPTETSAVHCGNDFDVGFDPYQSARLSR
jgi:hypothetical protein